MFNGFGFQSRPKAAHSEPSIFDFPSESPAKRETNSRGHIPKSYMRQRSHLSFPPLRIMQTAIAESSRSRSAQPDKIGRMDNSPHDPVDLRARQRDEVHPKQPFQLHDTAEERVDDTAKDPLIHPMNELEELEAPVERECPYLGDDPIQAPAPSSTQGSLTDAAACSAVQETADQAPESLFASQPTGLSKSNQGSEKESEKESVKESVKESEKESEDEPKEESEKESEKDLEEGSEKKLRKRSEKEPAEVNQVRNEIASPEQSDPLTTQSSSHENIHLSNISPVLSAEQLQKSPPDSAQEVEREVIQDLQPDIGEEQELYTIVIGKVTKRKRSSQHSQSPPHEVIRQSSAIPEWNELPMVTSFENAGIEYACGDIVYVCLEQQEPKYDKRGKRMQEQEKNHKDNPIAKIYEIRSLPVASSPSFAVRVLWYCSWPEAERDYHIDPKSWPGDATHVLTSLPQILLNDHMNGKLPPEDQKEMLAGSAILHLYTNSRTGKYQGTIDHGDYAFQMWMEENKSQGRPEARKRRKKGSGRY